jgi:Leucine Rich repeat
VIENISQRCGGFLKYLSLKGCQSVGDQSIRTLAQHCHNIEHLDLTECKKISDTATVPLSKHCNKLSSVSLESCSQISDLSLKSLSDGCPVSRPKREKLFSVCLSSHDDNRLISRPVPAEHSRDKRLVVSSDYRERRRSTGPWMQ